VTTLAVIDAGTASDPAGREGASLLTARALAEGTLRSDGAALNDRFERLGTALTVDADWDDATAGVTVLREAFADSVSLLSEVLRTPSFPERELARLREERLAELLQMRSEPRALADEMFTRFVYSGSSRYGLPAGGSEGSVSAITRDDVLKHHAMRYGPATATVIVVGDVEPREAERVVGAAFDGWRSASPPPAMVRAEQANAAAAVRIVAKADAPQSELRVGHVGLPRRNPDYFALVVMNAVLGGLFSSRINLNLRERHGYTYGAFSSFDWRRAAGPFVVSTAVRSDVTEAAAREVLGEIGRIREAPIAADELSLAVDYLDGVFPIRYETTASIALALANLVVHDLPDDYFDAYRGRVRAVTTDAVMDVARRHLHPDRLQLVCVGDPALVREPLASLGSGPVSVVDPEGRSVPV
jgi:zinc protease